MERTHKGAIIKFMGGYVDYDDYADNIVRSIPFWEEVDQRQYDILTEAADFARLNKLSSGYQIIELLTSQDTEVITTVQQYLDSVEQERKRIEADRAERAQKETERKMRKLAKDKLTREQLYKQLQQEFNETA